VERRLKILEFWKAHGLQAALDYAKDITPNGRASRSTLYRWRAVFEASGKRDRMGRLSLSALEPKSCKPLHCRKGRDYKELYEPIRLILDKYAFLGKNKIHMILKRMVRQGKLILKVLKEIPSVSTIGRIISKLRKLGRLPSNQRISLNGKTGNLHILKRKKVRKKRRNGFIPKKPGELVQMDGIILYSYGKRVYILNAIDYVSGKAASVILPSNKSLYCANFLEQLDKQMGFKVERILTDNGSEFLSYFHSKMERLGKEHFFNYVKKPIFNGKVERYNRTMQEELLNDPDMLELIAFDRKKAHERLQEYVDWYNSERPHQSLNYLSPNEYLLYLNEGDLKSQMY